MPLTHAPPHTRPTRSPPPPRRREEEEKQRKIAELEEKQLAAEDKYSSKQEEAEQKTKKLKKLWKKFQEVGWVGWFGVKDWLVGWVRFHWEYESSVVGLLARVGGPGEGLLGCDTYSTFHL